MCQEAEKNQSIMSIDLVIGGYHGKGPFRETIKLIVKFISGRNTTMIFRLVYAQCKNDNGDIMRSSVMALLWDRLKDICAGNFLGWTHKGRTQFISLSHGLTLPPPSAKTICNVFRSLVFFTGYLDVYASPWKEGEDPHIGAFDCMLVSAKWRDQWHQIVTK